MDDFIHLRQVRRIYNTGTHIVEALAGLSLDIPQGAFAAIVGRSGSGKSTLLHLLAGMDRPNTGEMRVGEWDLTRLSRKQQTEYRRTMVGIIFQQFNLVPTMSALHNVALPLVLAGVGEKERERRAMEALVAVGLSQRASHRPVELSGGEQQRVAIARALAPNPPLLLADEPTGNLDSDNAQLVVRLLADVAREQGKTVVVVTHHFAEVESVATHRFGLLDGQLAEAHVLHPAQPA